MPLDVPPSILQFFWTLLGPVCIQKIQPFLLHQVTLPSPTTEASPMLLAGSYTGIAHPALRFRTPNISKPLKPMATISNFYRMSKGFPTCLIYFNMGFEMSQIAFFHPFLVQTNESQMAKSTTKPLRNLSGHPRYQAMASICIKIHVFCMMKTSKSLSLQPKSSFVFCTSCPPNVPQRPFDVELFSIDLVSSEGHRKSQFVCFCF